MASATPVKTPAPARSQPATLAPPPVQLAKPKSAAAGSTSAPGQARQGEGPGGDVAAQRSASHPASAAENAPGAAALLTTADARGGTEAPDEPATTTQDPTVGVGGARAVDDRPRHRSGADGRHGSRARRIQHHPPPDDDAGSAPANGSGGLSAPPAP